MPNWMEHEIMWAPIGAPCEDAQAAAGAGRSKRMRLIDADALKEYCRNGMEDMRGSFTSELMRKYADLITEAFCKDIDEQPTVREWIPCSERLPENEQLVLVTDKDGTVRHCFYDTDVFKGHKPVFRTYEEAMTLYNIVAWMPLPEPWEGDNNGIS